MVKYADDETVVIPSSSKASVKSEWNNTKDWAQDNGLFINVAKTAQMSIYRSLSAKTDTRNIILNDLDEIKEVNQCRLLGVVIDSKLSFSEHVSSLLQTCSQRFYLLKLLKNQGTPPPVLHAIYQSIIINRVAYCISAWGGFITDYNVQKFNGLFRRAKKYGYTNIIFDFHGLMKHHDYSLF